MEYGYRLFESKRARKDPSVPLYHIGSGLCVRTEGYLSQVYLGLYKALDETLPVSVKDEIRVLPDIRIKKNLTEEEKIFFEKINAWMVKLLRDYNHEISVHHKGFDIFSESHPRTVLNLFALALHLAGDETKKTILAERKLERRRELMRALERVEHEDREMEEDPWGRDEESLEI